jgi:hypothetical protein
VLAEALLDRFGGDTMADIVARHEAWVDSVARRYGRTGAGDSA